jgi:hypothetical protein
MATGLEMPEAIGEIARVDRDVAQCAYFEWLHQFLPPGKGPVRFTMSEEVKDALGPLRRQIITR